MHQREMITNIIFRFRFVNNFWRGEYLIDIDRF